MVGTLQHSESHTASRPMHILLVEDNEDHAYLIRYAIEDAWDDVQFHHAPSAVDAMNYLRSLVNSAPDLILLDLKMPEVDGLDFLAALKLHSRWRQIPVVVLTTSSSAEDRTRAYQYHANSYVVKPVDASGFAQLIQDLHQYWNRVNQPPGDKPARDGAPDKT